MTEKTRQRRLHVENRMAELNAKYGPVQGDLPDWLDHYPAEPVQPAEVTESALAPVRSEALDLSRYG